MDHQQGCLVIFFTDFLALLITAGVADSDSKGSTTYAVLLITMNVLIFLSIWWNSWAAVKATFNRRYFQVCLYARSLTISQDIHKL